MSACTWNGRGNPRTIPGRHHNDCPGDTCRGCQPCTEPHCRMCAVAHIHGTCGDCMDETRQALHDIARMCHALPTEVRHRGIDGEAMTLLGPVADVEARQHVEASYLSGRLPEDWIEATHGKGCPRLTNEACAGCGAGELHPYTILGKWDLVWRDALEHAPDEVGTMSNLVDYLNRTMTYMGGFEFVPFEDFARDLRLCRNHMEGVLHDGAQLETGAPCMTCHKPLERVWGDDPKGDGWKCPRCNQSSTEAQYRFAVMHLHREEAEWLTDQDMQIRTGVKASTVRTWGGRGEIGRKRDQGRTVFNVADVQARNGAS